LGAEAIKGKRSFQLVEKQARGCCPILTPPLIDRPNVIVGFRSGPDVQVHPLR
jgi:hypothetical protein